MQNLTNEDLIITFSIKDKDFLIDTQTKYLSIIDLIKDSIPLKPSIIEYTTKALKWKEIVVNGFDDPKLIKAICPEKRHLETYYLMIKFEGSADTFISITQNYNSGFVISISGILLNTIIVDNFVFLFKKLLLKRKWNNAHFFLSTLIFHLKKKLNLKIKIYKHLDGSNILAKLK